VQDTYTLNLDLNWKEYFRLVLYVMKQTKIIRVLFAFLIAIGLLNIFIKALAPGKSGFNPLESISEAILTPVSVFLFFFVFALLGSILIVNFKPHLVRGIIQKSNFSGPADCDEFKRFLQQNMPL
jgi:hypothetical protein